MAIGLLAAASMAQKCRDERVPVPPENSDRPPVITLTNFVSGGSANVTPETVSSTAGPTHTAKVTPSPKKCEIPTLLFFANANNTTGGVADLHLVLRRKSGVAYDVRTTASRAPDGTAPVSLKILGHDNAGGAGGQPIRVMFDGGKLGCPTNEQMVIEVTAMNFNRQQTTLTETLQSSGLSSEGCICE